MTRKRLLIFHQGALGDLVTLFPLLPPLRDVYQAIDLICKHQIGQLACHLGLTDQASPVESAVYAALFGDGPVPEQLKSLNCYSSILLFSYSTDLSQRVGSLTKAAVHRIAPRPAPGKPIHATDHYAEHLKAAVPSHALKDWKDRPIFRDWRYPGFNPRRVLIHPGSGSRFKNWPVDHYLSLVQQLDKEGFDSRWLLGPADDHLAIDRLAPVERPHDLIALTETLRQAGGFIGNDSGVSHLAAFLGLPATSVFGPSDPHRWAPRGRATAVVQWTDRCAPCFETGARSCASRNCLMGVSHVAVMAAFRALHRDASVGFGADRGPGPAEGRRGF